MEAPQQRVQVLLISGALFCCLCSVGMYRLLGKTQISNLFKTVTANMTTATVKKLKFNNGNECPMIGLGTWKSAKDKVQAAVEHAIDVGYRHIDCAFDYENEDQVGAGISKKLKEGKVKREDLFVVSKLWNSNHRPEDVRPAIKKTLDDLKLDYLDLYLIHWPFVTDVAYKENVDYVDTWKAMEKLVEEGLAKNIGVSNFNPYQLGRVLKQSKIKPVNNQIECHPYLLQDEWIKFCQDNDVSVTAYSPLGSRDNPYVPEGLPVLMEDPVITGIAEKHGRTPAQILLRFQIQRGINVVPKSVTPSRIESNLKIFDFELSAEDIEKIRSTGKNVRFCTYDEAEALKYYPFTKDYKE